MQRDREVRENHNAPETFGGFGFRGSMFPSISGGKDPFNDPFFSRPHDSLFASNVFSSSSPANIQSKVRSKGPVIKELDSDAEEVLEGEEEDVDNANLLNRNPIVEHPEDQGTDHGKSISKSREVYNTSNHDKGEVRQPRNQSISFQRVTYGGINGAYYTATASRGTGDDGVKWEESKQADRTTGQATHRFSRGIHNKGHSITRKLDSDGKVDSVQTLHNLKEDDLVGFEQAWGGKTDRSYDGWNDPFNFPRNSGASNTVLGRLAAFGGFPNLFRERSHQNRGPVFDHNRQAQSAGGRPKKVITINIE